MEPSSVNRVVRVGGRSGWTRHPSPRKARPSRPGRSRQSPRTLRHQQVALCRTGLAEVALENVRHGTLRGRTELGEDTQQVGDGRVRTREKSFLNRRGQSFQRRAAFGPTPSRQPLRTFRRRAASAEAAGTAGGRNRDRARGDGIESVLFAPECQVHQLRDFAQFGFQPPRPATRIGSLGESPICKSATAANGQRVGRSVSSSRRAGTASLACGPIRP